MSKFNLKKVLVENKVEHNKKLFEDRQFEKTYTSDEVASLASAAGEIVLDAETALYDLAVANDKTPEEEIKKTLANFDIDLEDLKNTLQQHYDDATIDKDTGERWLGMDALANKGLLEKDLEDSEEEIFGEGRGDAIIQIIADRASEDEVSDQEAAQEIIDFITDYYGL